jgi:6,7-dimethyl-8-ribityllumazine synthase
MPAPKVAVIVSRFNDLVTKNLLQGCLKELKAKGFKDDQISVTWVPGALELPLTALKWAQRKDIAGVICLGAVIRGDTYHFELVANVSARGIMDVALRVGKPVIFGVLSTDTIRQANERSRSDGGNNKGRDAAQAFADMLKVISTVKPSRSYR